MGVCRKENCGKNSNTEYREGQGSGSENENVGQASKIVRTGKRGMNGGNGKRTKGEFGDGEYSGKDED